MEMIPYLAGAGIGILSWIAFFVSDRPIGCSTAYARTSGMIEHVFRGKKTEKKEYYVKFPPVVDWEWMLVAGIVIGAFVTAVFTGGFALEWVPPAFANRFGYDPVMRWLVALAGGVLLGLGARWAGGCTSGHGISGSLQLAVSSWIAVIVFFVSGIATAMIIYGAF